MKNNIVTALASIYRHLPEGQKAARAQVGAGWRNKTPQNRVRWLIASARHRAKRAGREFDDSLTETLCSDLPKRCPCCNVKLRYEVTSERGKPMTDTPSLDRVDSRQGYTIKNTRIICTSCNRLKSNGDLRRFKLLVNYLERASCDG